MILEFLPEAGVEVEEVTRYYEDRVTGLGAQFRIELASVCAAVVRQPLLWRERRSGFRRINFPNFPYYLAYFIRGNTVFIAAVAHGKRHPDYWKKRRT